MICTHYNKSIVIINKNLDYVYKKSESYPLFVSKYNVKKIINVSESNVSVEVGMKIFGLQLLWSGVGCKTRNQSIEYIQTLGLLSGMHAYWSFSEIADEVTKVVIKTRFKKIFLLGFILNILLKKTTDSILFDLRKSSEGGISNA